MGTLTLGITVLFSLIFLIVVLVVVQLIGFGLGLLPLLLELHLLHRILFCHPHPVLLGYTSVFLVLNFLHLCKLLLLLDAYESGFLRYTRLFFLSQPGGVGGPVGVSAGFWMGGGLADAGWGDGGRCFIALGEGGRVLEFCL
ncbi:hypothetical protein EYF80_017030 [Liparis tanakae]|uniref:Uncharacterized protein n=1 Tax=Liparis tanakae TaxID=230148 RepID=A0A4Z2I3U3_9TELE|nr:hypothetical protein EYF80_017030 [Liparis tanakae]